MTEFAQGSLSCSSNWVTRKDGTRHKASPHYKFQSLGGRGKRTYRNVPADADAEIRLAVDDLDALRLRAADRAMCSWFFRLSPSRTVRRC